MKKGGFKEAFAAEVDTEIDAFAAPSAADARDFEAFEHATRRKALDDAARALERRLNADHTDYAARRWRAPADRRRATPAAARRRF